MMAYTQLEPHSASTVWMFKDCAPVHGGYMWFYIWMVHCACVFQRSRVNCTGHYVKGRPLVKTLPNPLSSYHGDATANSQLFLNLKARLCYHNNLHWFCLVWKLQFKWNISNQFCRSAHSHQNQSVFKCFTIEIFALSKKMGKLHKRNNTKWSVYCK